MGDTVATVDDGPDLLVPRLPARTPGRSAQARPGSRPAGSSAPPSLLCLPIRLAGQPAADFFNTCGDGGVDDLVPDLDREPTEHLRVHLNVQVDVTAVGGPQPGGQALLLRVGQQHRAGDDRHQTLPLQGDEAAELLQASFQATSARVCGDLGDEAQGGRRDLGPEQVGQQRLLAGRGRVGQRTAQSGVGREDPAEAEQLVFDVVETAGPSASLAAAITPSRSTASARSPARDHLASTTATVVSSASAETLPCRRARMVCRLLLGRTRRVGERTAQTGLTVEQRGHREELVGQRAQVGRPGHAVEALLDLDERGPAQATHQRTAVLEPSSSSRKLVDDATLARLVLERLADDAAGEVGRQTADLGTELRESLRLVGLDLGVSGLDDAPGLGLGLLAELGLDLRALLASFLPEAGGLLAGLVELVAVLLKSCLGLGLGVFRLLDAAFDGLGALSQRLLDARGKDLTDDDEDEQERETTDDQLVGVRNERVVLLRRQERSCQWSWAQPSVRWDNASGAGVDERRDKADQGEGLGQNEAEEHVLADEAVGLGLAGDGLHTLAEDDAHADTGADRREAVTDRADVAGDFSENAHCGFLLLVGR